MLKCAGVVKTLAALVSVLVFAQIAGAQSQIFSLPLKAEQLVGLKVEDTDGQKIGTVRNLILDMRTGEVKFAVIGSGGLAGIHPTLRLAPAQIMSAATTKRETLSINATLGQWKGAPTFNRSQLASLAEPAAARQITLYFIKTGTRMPGTSRNLSGTSDVRINTSSCTLKLANDLIGRTVVNSEHQKLGEIVDLLVGFSQSHTAFAIVSTRKFFVRGREYAISVRELTCTDGNSRLIVDTNITTFQNAPPFSQQVWDTSSLTNPAVFSYSKPGQ